MKVLHVIPSVGPLRGGPSFAVQALTEALAERGVSVAVATTNDNAAGKLSVPLNSPIVQHGVTYWYFERQARFYTFSSPLYRWLSSHAAEYDLIHIHAIFSFASTAAAFVAAKRGVPYVVRPLGTLNNWGIVNRRPRLKQLSLEYIERPLLSRAACVHFTSEQERIEASEVAPIVKGRVIPNPMNGVNPCKQASGNAFVSRHPELAGKRIILFLSRLDPKKGLDLLLEAFAAISAEHGDAALVIAGDGDPEFLAGLKGAAKSLDIDRSVMWAGFLDAETKQAAFAAADVFALASYSENFGIAVVEAMAAGLPVVVSDQVAIHREIDAAGAGIVVPCDAARIAQAISLLLADPARAKAMGQQGKRFAEREYSREAVSDKLLDLYNQILN